MSVFFIVLYANGLHQPIGICDGGRGDASWIWVNKGCFFNHLLLTITCFRGFTAISEGLSWSFCSCSVTVSDVGEVGVGESGRGDTQECLISLVLWETHVVCFVSGRWSDGDSVGQPSLYPEFQFFSHSMWRQQCQRTQFLGSPELSCQRAGCCSELT